MSVLRYLETSSDSGSMRSPKSFTLIKSIIITGCEGVQG